VDLTKVGATARLEQKKPEKRDLDYRTKKKGLVIFLRMRGVREYGTHNKLWKTDLVERVCQTGGWQSQLGN